MNRRWLASIALLGSLLVPAAARADAGVTYWPAPAYLGSAVQFSACGFQKGETADLSIDNNNVAQGTAANDGCLNVNQTTPLDIATNSAHLLSMKGEASGTEQDGAFMVMPPMIPAQPAPVLPGGVAIVFGQFFAPQHNLTLIPAGLPPIPAFVDFNGNLNAQIPVLPNTPPGAYPVLVQDSGDPLWIANNQPTLIVTVLPQPSASPQTASGNWTLNVASTLGKDDGKLSVKASSTFNAPFSVSGNQLSGSGQLSIGVDINGPTGDSCHGESQIPFQVGGTQDGAGFHLTFTGINASAPVNVTCNNGISMPFALPAGAGSAPFDIEATDGKTVDLDGSNLFMMVPPTFSGHSHAVLTKT